MAPQVIDILAGTAPLIVNVPHDGRELPAAMGARMTREALLLPDTDWHMRDLYAFAADLGATITSARHSRYVVDLNRDPEGQSLYPGADTTEICPTSTFANEQIYSEGHAPDATEIAWRIERYWRPYHAALREVVDDNLRRFGVVLVFDAHSIRSVLPRFFEGRLPDLNLGTADGATASGELTALMYRVLDGAVGYDAVLNGRFKGGYITRHYGDPRRGVHAIQLEIAQASYMEERPPYRLLPDKADRLVPFLRETLAVGLEWVRANSRFRSGKGGSA